MRNFSLIFVLLIFSSSLWARTWTSADGSKTFEATLRTYDQRTGMVWVMNNRGRVLRFHQDVLSAGDRAFLQRGGKEEAVDTTDYGELIFEDDFERSESQEEKDEPGNGWTTSSDKTAKGYKQVDLRDGYLYIYTHAEANHATSVRQEFAFRDGTIALKVKFEKPDDGITLNFTDTGEKSVHAGHLFNVSVGTQRVELSDLKTGKMNQEIRKALKADTISAEQRAELAGKSEKIPHQLSLDEWHRVEATVEGDLLRCTINGEEVGSKRSPGFAHETKTMIRLLVARNVCVDELRIWRKE